MNTTNLLSKRNTIYGICAVWIMLFHVFRHISMPYLPVVTNIIGIGNMAVDVFFFYSGLCLSVSAKKRDYLNTGWRNYYKRRIVRIIIPYLIIAVPYYLWAAMYETQGDALKKVLLFFGNLSSATFWVKGTQTTWFVFGIAVFYVLFPLLYTFISKNGIKKQILLLFSLVVIAVGSNFIPIVKNSMILWARLPIFATGIAIGISDKQRKKPNQSGMIAEIIIIVLLGTIASTSELSKDFNIPQVARFLLYIPMTLAFLTILSADEKKVFLIEKVGSLSLETYLIHITLLHPLKYYGIIDILGYWLYLVLPIGTILLAFVINKVIRIITRKLEA